MPIYYFLIYAHQSFSTFPFSIYDGCTCINSIMKLDWPTKIFPFYSNSLQKFPNLFKSNSNYFQFPHLVVNLCLTLTQFDLCLPHKKESREHILFYYIILFLYFFIVCTSQKIDATCWAVTTILPKIWACFYTKCTKIGTSVSN